MDSVECIVVGAGVIGLAVARALALNGREVLVLEARDAFGSETSSRNSEVIHAGIYYPKDSLKARLCVSGRKLLYRHCAEYGVEHRRCGKLIVAADESELPVLAEIRDKAAANGVDDLQVLSREDVHSLEPDLDVAGALFSPSTGIIDSHALMLSFLGDIEDRGGVLSLRSKVEKIELGEGSHAVTVADGGMGFSLRCRYLVNAAGLDAPGLLEKMKGFPDYALIEGYMCKGSYYAHAGSTPFRHLVYPVPQQAGLGVHLTVDLAGQARFGPDVEWVEERDYAVDPSRAESFYAAIRRYWPGLEDGKLVPAYSGLRPKISPEGVPAADFMIQGREAHGVAGLVNLLGIESPGLTSSLAVAEEVVARLGLPVT